MDSDKARFYFHEASSVASAPFVLLLDPAHLRSAFQ